MHLLIFIFIEIFKLMIIGPVNIVLLPYMLIKHIVENFPRFKKKKPMTEEEINKDKRLKLVRKTNKLGFFTNSTKVKIIGRENLGEGMIVKMDYDPMLYEAYDVDGKKLVLHIKYDGDSTIWFVNVENLLAIRKNNK